VAGYVQIRGGAGEGNFNPYAKAATLEYGTDKARRVAERASQGLLARVGGGKKRLVARANAKAVHIKAFRYLRDPLEEMRPEIEAELAAALAELTDGSDSGGGGGA